MESPEQKKPSQTKRILTIIGYAIVGLIIFLAFFLRIHNLGKSSLWIDEGYTINAALSVQKTGKPILPSGATYNAHSGSVYLTAAALKLGTFDPWNPWQARLPAAIFGTLTIFGTYFFCRKFYKRKDVAIIAALMVAFSAWEIAWSRQARGYVIMQCFSLFSLGFFAAWLRDKKIIQGIGALVFLVGAYLGQSIAIILVPVYVLMVIISFFSRQKNSRQSWIILGVISTLALIGALVFIRFFTHGITINFQPYYITFLLRTYPFLLVVSAVPLVGLFFTDERPLPLFYNTISILAPLAILVFITPTLQFRYLLVIFPFIITQAALGVALLVQLIFKKYLLKSVITAAILGTVLGVGIFYTYLNIKPYAFYLLEPGSPQPSFSVGYQFIKDHQVADDVILSPYAHLTNIYLGKPHLLLPISLTGRSSELAATTAGGIDFYTGAPAIMTNEQLKEILTQKQGFIIMDRMAESRLKKTYLPLISSLPNVVKVYEKKSGPEQIKIFRFTPSTTLPSTVE